MEASQLASIASKDVHAALLEVDGIAPQDVTTTSITINTEHEYGPNGRQGPPKYAVGQGVSVRLRGATGELVANTVDAMVCAARDSLQLHAVSFQVSDSIKPQLLEAARKAAAADATSKAKLYAQSLGVQLGQVLDVWEEGGGASPPGPRQPAHGEMMMCKDAAPRSYGGAVSMGESTVSADVWVAFEIEG